MAEIYDGRPHARLKGRLIKQHGLRTASVSGLVEPRLACVVLAHEDPAHIHRLVNALSPFPVFLHCDVKAPAERFDAMTRDLPSHVTVMDRLATGWARWENVEAEVAGYRAALASTDASHVALLTGSDYPLASSAAISDFLGTHQSISFARSSLLPYEAWGRSGGVARLRYRHRAYRKRMLRLPVPRRLPGTVVLAGGSQVKVLARAHVAAIVDAVDANPELVRFWRSSWIADETFVPSLLNTPQFVPGWAEQHEHHELWWIAWNSEKRKSPPWLTLPELPRIQSILNGDGGSTGPRFFARKFSSSASGPLLDEIDRVLRA